eukprot:CAMPEP_0114260102 /NCGR_PEP_ID=MMETSP0058-20121206/20275_1 /TAXON_ID=36894 /ORGANISM="Pyramimonas parkeae, CCMP726" /LENGTH=276 /DNA_ID=CAMNT_0001375249 /DNA_START=50 /DNA_END=880 /DNA_ORIENTATION=+
MAEALIDVFHALRNRLLAALNVDAEFLSRLPGASLFSWSGVLGLVALLLGYYSLRAASTDGDGEGGARGEQVVRGSGAPPARAVGNTAAGPVDAGSSQAYATHTAKSQAMISGVPGGIRARLRGVHRLTISLSSVLYFVETDPSALSIAATVRSETVDAIKSMARMCEVFFITHVQDDIAQERVQAAIQEAGLAGPSKTQVGSACIPLQRVLFCGTSVGCTAIVRQLEPDLHIEGSAEVVKSLAPFVPRMLFITDEPQSASNSNVVVASSLHSFVS